jgi:hypothetical protein
MLAVVVVERTQEAAAHVQARQAVDLEAAAVPELVEQIQTTLEILVHLELMVSAVVVEVDLYFLDGHLPRSEAMVDPEL